MFRWRWLALSRLGTVVLVGYVAWLAWERLGPHKPEIGPVRRELANKIIPAIVDDLRNSRKDIRYVALPHFENDPTDYFTSRLRTVVEQSGALDLRDRTFGEKIADVVNVRHRSYGSLSAAVSRGRDLNVRGVIFGTIHSFETRCGGADIDVEVHLADVDPAQAVFSKRYDKDVSPTVLLVSNIEAKAKSFPWFQRLLGWLVAVLLLPVFTISSIRTMVRKGSNRANAFVLGIYTLVDASLAFLLVGAALSSRFSVVIFILAVVAAFVYNVRIMTFALRLEEA